MLQTVLYINQRPDASKKYLTKQYEFGLPFWKKNDGTFEKADYNAT